MDITYLMHNIFDVNDIDYVDRIDNYVNQGRILLEDTLKFAEKNVFEKTKRYKDSLIVLGAEVKLNDERIVEASRISSNIFASSSPLCSCIDIFWQMIWDNNINVIVMLTQWIENGIVKADPYFNTSVGELFVVSNKFLVKTVKDITPEYNELLDLKKTYNTCLEDAGIVVRRLKLIDLTGIYRPKYLRHIHYTKWIDRDVPDPYDMFLLLLLYSKIMGFSKPIKKKKKKRRKRNNKSLIHCSAGIGRTGTFIGTCIALTKINIIKNDIEENILEINIPKIITNMRMKRMRMIDTQKQLTFLYDFVRLYLTELIFKKTIRKIPMCVIINNS
jgi:protein tyrosine phosphatase